MSEKRAYVSEADYARRMKETVLPYLNARRYDGYFAGYDGNLLHYVKIRRGRRRRGGSGAKNGDYFARVYGIGGKVARTCLLFSARGV